MKNGGGWWKIPVFLAQDPTQARSPDRPVQRTRPPPHAVERTGRDGRPPRGPNLAARHPLAVADDAAGVGILGDALGRLVTVARSPGVRRAGDRGLSFLDDDMSSGLSPGPGQRPII